MTKQREGQSVSKSVPLCEQNECVCERQGRETANDEEGTRADRMIVGLSIATAESDVLFSQLPRRHAFSARVSLCACHRLTSARPTRLREEGLFVMKNDNFRAKTSPCLHTAATVNTHHKDERG